MFEELLRAELAKKLHPAPTPALADQLLMEAAERYFASRRACPFKPLDLVTPRKDSDYRGAAAAHVVVEVRQPSEPDFHGAKPGSNHFGLLVDIRVLSFHGETIAAHWVESWQFEPWVPPAASESAP